MFRVKCDQCGAETIVLGDPFGTEVPGCHCCPAAHVHDESANACPGAQSGAQHPGAPCPYEAATLTRTLIHPLTNEAMVFHGSEACIAVSASGEPCPGGHCGLGVEGCTVCRPVTITYLGAAPAVLAGAN